MLTLQWISLPVKARQWSYTTKAAKGKCRIDNEPLRLRFTLTLTDTGVVPDVLAIEKWWQFTEKDRCDNPATVEEYGAEVLKKFGGTVTMTGSTRTHGRISVTLGG